MTTDIKQIGERIKGLRDTLEKTPREMSRLLEMDENTYLAYENGTCDISISVLQRIASEFNIDISTLMFDEEPRMSTYFITRKDQGASVERVSAYKYQSLTAGFVNNVANIFQITVDPTDEESDFNQNIHAGQEFNFVLEGTMAIHINGKKLILNEGDSIYFDSSLPHGMKALNNKPVKFLAAVLKP